VDEKKFVQSGTADPWVMQKLHHWAESRWMVREVEELGARCEEMALPSAGIPSEPVPLPNKFSVLIHVPTVRLGRLYGLDQVLRVAANLPQIPFELVGLKEGTIPDPPGNLLVHGRVPELSEFYKRAIVLWRPVRHDGLSFMVREALGYGRHVLYTYPFAGCVKVDSAEEAQEQIVALFARHQKGILELNTAGVNLITENYQTNKLKEQILARLQVIAES
jgi:hypothetical protein